MDLATKYFLPAIVVLLASVGGIHFLVGKWIQGGIWLSWGLFLALTEFVSVALTGVTISQNYWNLHSEMPNVYRLLNILLGSALFIIVIHLAKFGFKA